MGEFDFIAKYFAPLTDGDELCNDAAVLDIPADKQLVVTKDVMNAGVHFFGDESPALIAKKLLRVNLSDLAAMGAEPYCYFLGLALPHRMSSSGLTRGSIHNQMDSRLRAENDLEQWIADFASGLKDDQTHFGLHLAGGDTTSTRAGLSLSLTAFGLVPKGTALTRSGAKAGDIIYVSGTIGDAALGLTSDDAYLKQRYQLPQPRLALGQALRGIVSSCMDISDGLLQDLGHICSASDVGATINRPSIPISKAAHDNLDWDIILGGGDDYELLFTVPKKQEDAIEALAKTLELPLTCIGSISKTKKLQLMDAQGDALPIPAGYTHF